MELSPRLRAIAAWVPQDARFADIGTDHAFLPLWLLQKGRIDRAIVSDLRRGPLDRAKTNAQRFGLADRMEFRLCDGLSAIRPEEVDTVSIAGMGGETIAQILAAAPWTRTQALTLLLQPMSSAADLRAWLSTHGFRIAEEKIMCEGKTLYTIMKALPGSMPPLTPAEIWAGRQTPEMVSPLRARYLEDLHRRALRAVDGLRRSERESDAPRLAELEQRQEGRRDCAVLRGRSGAAGGGVVDHVRPGPGRQRERPPRRDQQRSP